MTETPDDRLTAATHLAAILSIDLRPSGKLEGAIRDHAHLYRFSGLVGLPPAVLRWVTEEVGRPHAGGLEPAPTDEPWPWTAPASTPVPKER